VNELVTPIDSNNTSPRAASSNSNATEPVLPSSSDYVWGCPGCGETDDLYAVSMRSVSFDHNGLEDYLWSDCDNDGEEYCCAACDLRFAAPAQFVADLDDEADAEEDSELYGCPKCGSTEGFSASESWAKTVAFERFDRGFTPDDAFVSDETFLEATCCCDECNADFDVPVAVAVSEDER
jgi:hypothetical protein